MSLVFKPPTSVFEKKHLERLPFPTVEETCAKYLRTVAVLSENQEEIENTKHAVEEFINIDGPILQEDLKKLAKESPTSFIEGFWDTMYMELRDPVMINVSPFGLYKRDKRREDPIDRAASLMYSVARFAKKLEKGKVNDLVGMVHRGEMCVSQYGKIFSSRIPQVNRDTRILSGHSHHIHVICLGHHYIIEVMDDRRKLVPEEQIIENLKAVSKDAMRKQYAGHDIGYMTTTDRTTWAKTRAIVLQDPINRRSLKQIDEALVTVILDHRKTKSLTHFAKLTAHSMNGRSRWFDKCIQLVVYTDGNAGVILEHSPIDGDTQHGFANWVVMDAMHREPKRHPGISYNPTFEVLNWSLIKPVRSAIRDAELRAKEHISQLDLQAKTFTEFGSQYIKKNLKISPNSLLQMAFQLAYFRMHLKPGSTYEAMNMKQYYHGRTATVRTVSADSHKFCQLFYHPITTTEEKEAALRKACNTHRQLCKESMAGKGVDRHLYVLMKLAEQRVQRLPNLSIPKLFLDPLYARMKTDLITSSNMSGSAAVILGGFGPTASEGFGCGYIMDPDSITLCITNYHSRAEIFMNMVVQSLKDLRDLLLANQRPPQSKL